MLKFWDSKHYSSKIAYKSEYTLSYIVSSYKYEYTYIFRSVSKINGDFYDMWYSLKKIK